MCGRYSLHTNPEVIALYFKLGLIPEIKPRYNIAPQQGNPRSYVPVIRFNKEGEPEVVMMQWWLLPFWSKEPRIRYTTFNAKVETVATAPSFRVPFKRQRCLIPASGWYEWQELPAGKLPWYMHPANAELAMLCGLWDRWEKDGEVIESCSIIVGAANNALRPIHDRMPFVLPSDRYEPWLARALTDPDRVMKLLEPVPDDAIKCHRVSTKVNNTRNDAPSLIEPIESVT